MTQFDTLFAQEVLEGLLSTPKKLPSKYFYDAEGDRLFQRIMAMPEYYLTNSEAEIFNLHKESLFNQIDGNTIDLIELGAGDGSKTQILIRYFLNKNLKFNYLPIDISSNILGELKKALSLKFPNLKVIPQVGEYLEQLQQLLSQPNTKKLALFLGANIGNMTKNEAQNFLKKIASSMQVGDLFLIGFDLKKDPQIILDAYNDSAGITAAFNLNLLRRINRELDADFNLNFFQHWETYNPITGETKSHLISNQSQTVNINSLNQKIEFERWEAIHTELSLKYSFKEITQLAQNSGFSIIENFLDKKEYFTDSLWQKV